MPAAPPSSASVEPAAERSILENARIEALRLVYHGLSTSTLASGGVALAFAAALALRAPTLALGLWLAAMLAITGYRFRLARAFGRAAAPDPIQPGTGLDGLAKTLCSGGELDESNIVVGDAAALENAAMLVGLAK